MSRTSARELAQQAEAAFIEACRHAGFGVAMPPNDAASYALMITRGDESWSVELKARAVADERPPDRTDDADVFVVVADVITARVRDTYEQRSISWFDRRGHLRLIGPGLDIDTALDPLPRAHSHIDGVPRRPIAGRGGIEVAVTLLLEPEEPVEVRPLARRVDMSPSTISIALRRLRDASLVTPSNRPLVPELFWELSAHWDPAWVWLRHDPGDPGEADGTRDVLVRTGDVAAATLGAPIVMGPSPRGAWYVASSRELHLVTERCGVAVDDRESAGRVAVAPSAQIMQTAQEAADRQERRVRELLAPSLIVALDLAVDPGRGREILRSWRPQEAVWHR